MVSSYIGGVIDKEIESPYTGLCEEETREEYPCGYGMCVGRGVSGSKGKEGSLGVYGVYTVGLGCVHTERRGQKEA